MCVLVCVCVGWRVSQQTAWAGREERKELLGDDIRATSTVEAVAAETSAGGSGLCVWLSVNGCSTVAFLPLSYCTLIVLTVCMEGQRDLLLC